MDRLLPFQFSAFETLVSGIIDTFPQQLQKWKIPFTAIMTFIMFLAGLPFVCRVGICIVHFTTRHSSRALIKSEIQQH